MRENALSLKKREREREREVKRLQLYFFPLQSNYVRAMSRLNFGNKIRSWKGLPAGTKCPNTFPPSPTCLLQQALVIVKLICFFISSQNNVGKCNNIIKKMRKKMLKKKNSKCSTKTLGRFLRKMGKKRCFFFLVGLGRK